MSEFDCDKCGDTGTYYLPVNPTGMIVPCDKCNNGGESNE